MILEVVFQSVAAVQTELTIFVIAICVHQLLFGKYGFSAPLQKKASLSGHATLKTVADDTLHQPRSVQSAGHLTQLARQSLRLGAGKQQLTVQLLESLQDTPDEASPALAEMLRSLGKAVTLSVLAAVRDTLRELGQSPNSELSELLMRNYFTLRMYGELDSVLADALEAKSCTPAVATIAVRAAVAREDLDSALALLFNPASALLKEGELETATTPSAAPQGALQQVSQLAMKQGQLPELLRRLREQAPFLAPAALETALATAVRLGRPALPEGSAEELARTHGVVLTSAARCALLQSADSRESARRIFSQAAALGSPPAELLVAATAAATKHDDMEMSEDILRKLPPKAPPEVAAAVLRLHVKGPLQRADSKTLDLWQKHLAGIDIVANTRAAKMISEISFKHNRPDVLGQLLSTGPPGPSHVALLKSFGSEGRLAEAKFVFEVCSEKSTLLYNALLDACIECKDLKEAEKVMEQAVAQGMADAVTYNTMIKKHLQRGDLNVVRATVETMRTAGGSVAPNCVTFNEYIDAAIRTNTKLAWDLIEEMKVCGLTPNSVTCSIVLKGVQRTSAAEDVEKAIQLAEEVEADEVLVSSVCEACIRGGRADLLQRSLRRMKNVSINGAHTFGSMVRAYGFLGDLRGAWNTWKDMRLIGVIPTSTTMGCMVEALASNGDAESAHQLVRELAADEQTRSLLNSTIYGSVLKGFSHQKKFDRVWAVYQEMVDANMEMALATYNALLDACARSGDMPRIGVLLQDMGRQNIEANLVTYSTVLKAYVQEGKLTRAFELFEEMKASKHMQPDEIVYNTLIDGCARCTLYDRGVKVLEEMQQKGVRPSVYTISVLVKLAARCKRPKQAAGLLNDISRKYNIRLNVHAYNNLASAWTQQGQMREAFETIERMLHDGVWPDVRTYTIIPALHMVEVDGRWPWPKCARPAQSGKLRRPVYRKDVLQDQPSGPRHVLPKCQAVSGGPFFDLEEKGGLKMSLAKTMETTDLRYSIMRPSSAPRFRSVSDEDKPGPGTYPPVTPPIKEHIETADSLMRSTCPAIFKLPKGTAAFRSGEPRIPTDCNSWLLLRARSSEPSTATLRDDARRRVLHPNGRPKGISFTRGSRRT